MSALLAVLWLAFGLALIAWSLRQQQPVGLLPAPEEAAAPVVAIRESLPIVLVHGFAGFDELGIGQFRQAYFRGVRERLSGAGIDVRTVKLSPVASLRERAAELASQVHAMKGGRLHLVAHSMGGLDARLGLSKLGLADRVATLVTLGTPHRGTPLASIVPHLGKLRSLLRGLEDLSPESIRRIEDELVHAEGVRYASVLLAPRRKAVSKPLLPTYLWLERMHGESDGLVPTASQRSGTVMATIDADHWGAIGWGGFEASTFYERLSTHLARDEALETFDQPH